MLPTPAPAMALGGCVPPLPALPQAQNQPGTQPQLKPAALVSPASRITVREAPCGAAGGAEIAAWTHLAPLGERAKLRLGPGPDQNS